MKPANKPRAAAPPQNDRQLLQRLIQTPKYRVGDFEPVAKLLTPFPEAWLSEYLCQWAPTIFLDQGVLTKQPPRAAMRARLAGVSAAATTLLVAFGDAPTMEFLDRGAEGPLPARGYLQGTLSDIRDRAERAAQSPALVNAEGKTKAGTGRALPEEAALPQATCAVVIAEAWKFCRGKYPGARNPKAAEAAEAYWQLAGCERPRWGGSLAAGWRLQFETARLPKLADLRAECCRHLLQHAHQARLLAQEQPEGSGEESA